MSAEYRNVELTLEQEARSIRVRFDLVNQSQESWRPDSGFFVGWQVFDPGTSTFIREGDWTSPAKDLAPSDTCRVALRIHLPLEPGPYRIYISPVRPDQGWDYQHGRHFLLIDARVENGRALVVRKKITTLPRLRWEKRLRSVPKAFTYPVLTFVRNHRLIRSMVKRDILARYRGSFGDVLWTVLNPLLLMSTYFFVFGVVLQARFGADRSPTGFALYFLAGILPWLAFSEASGRSPFVILEHRTFVKKLVFPLETLPINQVVAGLVTELLALAVFLAALLLLRGRLPLSVFWLPVLLVPQLLFTLGVCWFLAALGAFVRDLGQVMGFLLTLWFFLTPICYPEQNLPAAALTILKTNPFFVLAHGYRAIFLEGRAPEFSPMWKLWLLSAVVCILGHAWFYKLRKSFADVI